MSGIKMTIVLPTRGTPYATPEMTQENMKSIQDTTIYAEMRCSGEPGGERMDIHELAVEASPGWKFAKKFCVKFNKGKCGKIKLFLAEDADHYDMDMNAACLDAQYKYYVKFGMTNAHTNFRGPIFLTGTKAQFAKIDPHWEDMVYIARRVDTKMRGRNHAAAVQRTINCLGSVETNKVMGGLGGIRGCELRTGARRAIGN